MALGIGNAGTKGSTPTVTAASGTANTIAKYTSATAIGDSSITDTGALVTVANNVLIDGNADEAQLTVQGHATQTAATLLTETSAGVDRLWVGNADMYWYYSTTANDYIRLSSAGALSGASNALGGKYMLRVAGASEIAIRTAANAGIGWGDNNNDSSAGAQVTAFMRDTAGVIKTMQGASSVLDTAGWVQNTAGRLVTTSDQTVDSTTMANATGLVTGTIATTRKISFVAELHFSAGDTLADGVKVDFDQGTATATAFIASATLFDGPAFGTLSVYRSTALATDFEATSTATTDFWMLIRGHLVVNGAGTFGIRFAKEADAGTALTLRRGSALFLEDMP